METVFLILTICVVYAVGQFEDDGVLMTTLEDMLLAFTQNIFDSQGNALDGVLECPMDKMLIFKSNIPECIQIPVGETTDY